MALQRMTLTNFSALKVKGGLPLVPSRQIFRRIRDYTTGNRFHLRIRRRGPLGGLPSRAATGRSPLKLGGTRVSGGSTSVDGGEAEALRPL